MSRLPRLFTIACACLLVWTRILSGQTYGVAVTPDGQTVSSKAANTTGHTQIFRITNEGTAAQTFTISCAGASNVTCLSTSDTVETINGNSFKNFTATYSVGNEGSGQLYFTATGPQSTDQGSITVPVVLLPGWPRIDPLPYLDAKQDFGRCAAGCFAATYAHSTVPFYSLDAARNVTLVYHGDRLTPKPIVAVDVFPDTTFGTWPTEYQLQVKINGALVTFTNGEQTLRFNAPTNNSTRWRIGGQYVATGFTHGKVYPMQILVTAKIGATLYTNTWSTQYLHIDESKSPIARGWTVAGIQKAFFAPDTGVLITEGDGSATYFRYNKFSNKYDTPAGDFSRLDSLSGKWVRSYPDSTKVTFNTSGLMTSMTSRFGDSTWVTYSSGRISTIKDHFANAITFAYGAAGLSSITDPTSRVTTVSVATGDSTLTWIQDPDNVKTNFGYDGSKRLLTITARNNKVTTLAYDANSGRVATITAPAVPIYGSGTPASPVTTFASWQKLGVPYVATAGTPFAPVRADTAFARVTEPGGALTRFTVNRWGSPIRTVMPMADGARDSTIVTYTVEGLPARIVRPGYGGSDFDSVAYNGSGLVTYSKAAQATATTLTYGAYAQPLTSSTQSMESVTWFRGSLGKVDSIRVGSSTVARYTSYDAFGRPLGMRNPGADTTTFVYFTSGTNRNLNKVTLSGGRTRTYRYDTQGRVVFDSSTGAPSDTITYGTMNQVTASRKKTIPGGTLLTTSFQYDSMFNVTQVTDPKGQNYKYNYNALGWLIRQEDPAVKRDTMQYSIDGDLRRVTNRRNLDIDFTYDSLHRAKTRVGTASMSYAYPLNGMRIVGVSPVATDTIFLNVRGQPDSAITRMASQRYARRYHYTSAGLPDSLYGYGGVTLTTRGFSWDVNKGFLTGIKLGTSLTSISPDAGLQDSSIVLPASAGAIGRTFGSLHNPVKITSTAFPSAERWLGFDGLGRISRHLNYGGQSGRFFAYDSLGRFQKGADSSTTGTPPPGCPDLVGSLLCTTGLSWTYTSGTLRVDTVDVVGNRTSKGGTYAPGTNRITAFDGCTYVTDAAGSDSVRTCGSTVTTFGWNKEGQLTSLAVTGQSTATFDYDAFGRLVRKSSGGSPASYFVWDGANLLAEVGSTGTTLTAEYSYYPGVDRLHAVIVGGTRHYAFADGLGNVLYLGGEAGSVTRTFTYDDWGQITATTDAASLGSKDRARWKDALWFGEETELYYMRNRWYEPKTGRFLSEDPIGLAGGLNPSVYTESDPINGFDPTGLFVEVRPIFKSPRPVDWGTTGTVGRPVGSGGGGGGPGAVADLKKRFEDFVGPRIECSEAGTSFAVQGALTATGAYFAGRAVTAWKDYRVARNALRGVTGRRATSILGPLSQRATEVSVQAYVYGAIEKLGEVTTTFTGGEGNMREVVELLPGFGLALAGIDLLRCK